MATPTLDEMHKALGEFLTECGRVEFTMLLVVDFISEAPIEHLFDEYSPLTFGGKIEWFKKWCEFSGVSDEKKPKLEEINEQLANLLPKRNYLVHGETWEGALKGQERQPYRVGVIKKTLKYLDEFDRGVHGDNVFNVEQVRAVTEICEGILDDLDFVREVAAPDG